MIPCGGPRLGLECSGLLCLSLLLWTRRTDGLADFSNYLWRILASHCAQAPDGRPLLLHCPRHSSVSIQAAVYGDRDDGSCSSPAALQKLLSECQGHRRCELPVNPLLFGEDPCPGTAKHLYVEYKCKPTEHKRLVVCEGKRLVLRCKPPRVLNIYAAVYGSGSGGPERADTCPSQPSGPPPFECLNHEAVRTVSQSCYGRRTCTVVVDDRTFRDPCFPGTRKHLTVLYACVPETLLREAAPDVKLSTSPELGVEKVSPVDVAAPVPKSPRLPDNSGAMMSSSLMTYAYIRERPELAALFFTSSVCVGLLLTLLAVSVRVRCGRSRPSQPRKHRGEGEDEEGDGEVSGTDSSLVSAADRKSTCGWEEVTYVTEAAERAERIERREMVIQEIWMNAYMNGTSCALD